ncbi:MAG TPA: cell division protein FtsH, partial [Arcobacter skirrowii]|nr:cell division protein FtsH [Aliarcobacter skirrowii]
LKNEKYFVSNDDLKKAYDLASKIVEEYKMALNANELIVSIKDELRATLSQNIEKIEKLKDIMLKNEVITLED